jgi:hypothetical protein
MANDDKAIDMRHGKQTEYVLVVVRLVPHILYDRISVWLFERTNLHCAGQYERKVRLRMGCSLVFAITFLCEIMTPFCMRSVVVQIAKSGQQHTGSPEVPLE